jgi:recombinational DNA repair ATPase RecF
VLLIDDLASELDEYNVNKIITSLSYYKNNLQVFITGSKQQGLINILSTKVSDSKWFEISKGIIAEYKQ